MTITRRKPGTASKPALPPTCGLVLPEMLPKHVKCGQTRGLCDVCKLCPDHCLGHFQMLEGRIVGTYAVRVRA